MIFINYLFWNAFIYCNAVIVLGRTLNQCNVTSVGCEDNAFTSHKNVKLNCLGTDLPYSRFSSILSNETNVKRNAKEKLELWKGIQNVPKCWQALQPLLCAIYMPKCVLDGYVSHVEAPSKELCERTREACKIVTETRGWPEVLQCDFPHYKRGCKVSYRTKHTKT